MYFFHYFKKHSKYRTLEPILGLLLCTSTQIYAADWESIKKTKDYELLVDMDSYNVADGLPLITAKTVFTSSKSLVLNNKKMVFTKELSTKQFNCKLQSYKQLETRFLNKKNVLIWSEIGVKSFEPIALGSNNATISSLVCQVHKMLGGI